MLQWPEVALFYYSFLLFFFIMKKRTLVRNSPVLRSNKAKALKMKLKRIKKVNTGRK